MRSKFCQVGLNILTGCGSAPKIQQVRFKKKM